MNKLEEKNIHGHIKTPFDDRRALIIGDHPHSGQTATCLGADLLLALGKYGLYFNGTDTDFYVMEPKNVQWIK